MPLASEVLTSHVLNQEASLGVAGEPSRTREEVWASGTRLVYDLTKLFLRDGSVHRPALPRGAVSLYLLISFRMLKCLSAPKCVLYQANY